MTTAPLTIRLNPNDNVVVARLDILPGTMVEGVAATQRIPAGHKVATRPIALGEPIRKFDQIIGFATKDVGPGEHVHVHNCGMREFARDYAVGQDVRPTLMVPEPERPSFGGFVRGNAKVGTRNYIGILSTVNCSASVSKFINDYLADTTNMVYLAFLGLLIVGFTYFYTAIAFDPVQQADNLRKQGGFIPGIRPGPQTEHYLTKVLNRITLPGALFVAILAISPTILVGVLLGSSASGAAYSIGGSSLLIAVGVALETMKQVDSQLMMRNYEGFLSAKK